MTAMIRNYASGIAVSMTLAGACMAFPQWPRLIGIEVGPRQRRSVSTISEPGPAFAVFKARIGAKVRIIAQLRAGELDLFEAAGWFERVNQEPAEYADRSWQSLPGDSKEEKLCRQVISWAKGSLAGSVSESELASFAEGLEARLTAHLCDRGRVQLPEWR